MRADGSHAYPPAPRPPDRPRLRVRGVAPLRCCRSRRVRVKSYPSRARAGARDRSAAGHGDPVGLRNSADGGGWLRAVPAATRGCGTDPSSTDAHGHSSCKWRTTSRSSEPRRSSGGNTQRCDVAPSVPDERDWTARPCRGTVTRGVVDGPGDGPHLDPGRAKRPGSSSARSRTGEPTSTLPHTPSRAFGADDAVVIYLGVWSEKRASRWPPTVEEMKLRVHLARAWLAGVFTWFPGFPLVSSSVLGASYLRRIPARS